VRDADLLLVVGPRLGEMTTSGYTLLDVPQPRQRMLTAIQNPAPTSSSGNPWRSAH